MSRAMSVVRIHLLARAFLLWPWGILATAFAINLLIFGLFLSDLQYHSSGGLASIYIVMFIFSAQCVSQVFPYALGMSVSRRTFYLATAFVTIGISIVFGVVLYLISVVEGATNGWGIRLRFFRLGFMETHNPVTQILVYVVPFLVLGFLGVFCGVVLRRWGLNGILTLSVLSTVVFGGGAALITWRHGWRAINDWWLGQSAAGLIVGWPILIAALLAVAGYAGIRRATS